MTYPTAVIKRNIELICMSPFVWLGRLAGWLFPLKTQHHIFLFFPSADIGGSIKVNADITQCIKDQRPLIIFSKKPKNGRFRQLFDIEGVRVIDLHRYIDHKWYHFVNFFFRGVLASWINKNERPVIFGGESLFFYKIVPHVKKQTRVVELCHLNTWFNFSQMFVKYIDYRIFSTPKIKRDAEEQYRRDHVPDQYFERMHFMDNKIDIPPFREIQNNILQVLYVGRGAPQKRVHLIAEIARRMQLAGKPVHFSFVGDVEKIVPPEVQPYCTLYGNIQDERKLHEIYLQSDVLILTSAYEGLPIVVMDMMARGKTVLSTAVDGIPDYITHEQNGMLIYEREEEKIVENGIALIDRLAADPALRKSIGKNAYAFAVKHFSGEVFCSYYRGLLCYPYQS
jgi:glycosyltransferase involved in cell wall biosynthesis